VSEAVVLLSGGLDSATALAIARSEGRRCHALSVDYGQRHAVELASARRLAGALGAASHKVVRVDLRAIGGSALTGEGAVPEDRRPAEMGAGVPATYVPARNTVLLALALAWGEVLGAEELWIGVSAVDYSGYPDCRPEFIRAFEALARVATKAGVEGHAARVRAPLIGLSKAETIRRGLALGVPYGLTHSCYAPDEAGRACGRCDSCRLRRKGFDEAGVADPTEYAEP
jgi:7-cyano-7-deazaguanine synthase